VIVPDAQPKTKPKACNYALIQAEGKYVVIYDAEDRPDRDQLKKIVVAYSKAEERIVCIQCKLNYYNRDQNLLTQWFTIEYSSWFDLFMPGLDAADSPIPLGGTSNHLVSEKLIELGAWDSFNVTEDADLGVRLHKFGYKTAIVDSTTYEEANSDLYNWIRQRSRWVKGYIQTRLVHMRHPVRLGRQMGWRSWWSFQFVIAGTFFGFLLNPGLLVPDDDVVADEGGSDSGAIPGLRVLRGCRRSLHRQFRVHVHQCRGRSAPRISRSRQVRAAEPAVLGADVGRGLQGLLPALLPAVLLGEDRARSRRGA
jgi:hypothetical protein